MPNASFKLPNGTEVAINGTVEEVNQLIDFYSKHNPPKQAAGKHRQKPREDSHGETKIDKDVPDLTKIVNTVKNCDESEPIEKSILDRTSLVDRTLLPLYIVHEYMQNKFALTSGQIAKIVADLGIPIAQANISGTLSGTASRYVMGDKVRRRGQAVRYKLSRRGLKYVKEVLQGDKGED